MLTEDKLAKKSKEWIRDYIAGLKHTNENYKPYKRILGALYMLSLMIFALLLMLAHLEIITAKFGIIAVLIIIVLVAIPTVLYSKSIKTQILINKQISDAYYVLIKQK